MVSISTKDQKDCFGRDRNRKTIKYYLSHLAGKGISRGDPQPEKGLLFKMIGENKNPGGYLLSHTFADAVPLAFLSLTSVFGMGTGVASAL